MKRQISTFLVLILCFCAWAEPVKAAEVNNGWVNLLDYGTANSSGSNLIYYEDAGGSLSVMYPFPDYINVVYVDMLFRSNSSNPTISYKGSPLTVVKVGNDGYNLFRAYGRTPSYGRHFTFSVGYSDGTWVDFIKIAVSTTEPNGTDIEAYCQIQATDFDQTIHYVPTDEINHRMINATQDYADTWFTSYIWTNDWKKYDYIDFQLMFHVHAITSISAVMGSTNVPVEVSYLEGAPIEGNAYYVTMRMDVSQLDRSINDYPMIIVFGRLDAGKINSVDFVNCSGSVDSASISPMALYFQNLNTWIRKQTADLSAVFSGLGESISDNFANLRSWIREHTDSIKDWMTEQTSDIGKYFDSLELGIESWIQNQTRELTEVFRGDDHAGDDFQQDVADKDQELEDMADVMDSVTKPNIGNIDVSVDTYVRPADVNTLTAPLMVFLTGDIFGPIAIMSILMATVGYVLYGKR